MTPINTESNTDLFGTSFPGRKNKTDPLFATFGSLRPHENWLKSDLTLAALGKKRKKAARGVRFKSGLLTHCACSSVPHAAAALCSRIWWNFRVRRFGVDLSWRIDRKLFPGKSFSDIGKSSISRYRELISVPYIGKSLWRNPHCAFALLYWWRVRPNGPLALPPVSSMGKTHTPFKWYSLAIRKSGRVSSWKHRNEYVIWISNECFVTIL